MDKRIKHETGNRYGRLTIIGISKNRSRQGQIKWNTECDCGSTTEVCGGDLRSGHTTSCGCLRTKHGRSYDYIYKAWTGIKQRCRNKNNANYMRYGGRGIDVCDEWFDSFSEFYKFIGDRPSDKHSIDRIDNDNGYFPGNCKWSTVSEQVGNRRNTVFLTIDGVTKQAKLWSDESGIPLTVILSRVRSGWDHKDAANRQMRKKKYNCITGISWSVNRWEVKIMRNGIRIYGGRFANYFDAVCARKSLENRLPGRPA